MSSGVPSPPALANKIGEAALPTPVSSTPSASLRWSWQGMQSNFHDFLKSEVDPELSAIPLAAYCFMTGWMCAALTHLPSFSRDSLISYRTATQCPSPPYSFGVRSKLATRCRCISRPHAQRPLTIGFSGDYLARPCACPPLPGFSWAPRHLLPHRGQAGPHLSDDLSFRRIYRPHR